MKNAIIVLQKPSPAITIICKFKHDFKNKIELKAFRTIKLIENTSPEHRENMTSPQVNYGNAVDELL